MHDRIIKDNFCHHYRLRLPGDSFLPVTIAPKSFWDLTLTETFVRHLRVPTDYWEQVLSGFPVTPYDPNRTLEGHVSQLLIEGRITLYPVSHLDQHHKHATTAHPIITGENGISYQLAPASVLLVEAHSKIKSFASKEAAEAFIQGMNQDEAQLRGLCQSINLPVSNGDGVSLMAGLGDALLDGKLVAIVRQSSVTPPVSADSASTSTASSTSKPVSLGPHAEGLHNQEWDEVKIKDDSFKPTRQVDMENLSDNDEAAKEVLIDQGWKDKKINEILNSSENVSTKELQPGDKLYGFDTQGRNKNIKTSAYWLDEAGYQDVKSKYYKDGNWDKEGVKNYLALPCFNRASSVSTVEVTQKTTVIEARIVKARELVQYTDKSGYTTRMIGKIMSGGGTQVTANPAVLSVV